MEFDFDLDPCPLNPEFDPEKHPDGLKMDWSDKRVFCNPPWSDIMPWVLKGLLSKARVVVFVVPARTDTEWFHLLKYEGAEMRLFRKRVHFIREGVGANPTDGTLVAVAYPRREPPPKDTSGREIE
jgi:hypothetical protein